MLTPASHNLLAGELVMVSEARGRLYRRKDGKYFIYIPSKLAEDSMFPFRGESSVSVKITFDPGDKNLVVGEWYEEE